MAILSNINYFKELLFYNVSIDKPKIKRLSDINLLAELPFYERLSIIKTDQAFSGYARPYKVEIVERKHLIVQLEASKLSTKDLFSDLINEIKGFKYKIIIKVLLKKYKPNGEIEFAPIYFNSVTKLIINHRYKLDQSFQEILYRIDAWINEGSGWIIESIESKYINVSAYKPLVGSSYIDLPIELRSPRKGLINIKSNDQKCFLWCHVRHINPTQDHPGRIKKLIEDLPVILTMKELSFLCRKKILARLKYKIIFVLTCLVMKMSWFIRLLFLSKNLKIQWIYYYYMKTVNRIMCTSKILTHLCFIKQKIKIKNGFVKVVYNALVVKRC